jgi:Ca-activated chloride channel family protein
MSDMLAEFHFLRPVWLSALALLPFLIAWTRGRRGGSGPWEDVVAPHLQPYVLDATAPRRRESRWPRWLMALGALLGIIALAGPTWRRLPQPVFRSQGALVIAFDLSRSMDAADLTPSRVARARLKLLDLLQRRREGQTALIVYAAQAFVVTPLTNDAATISALVDSLATELMPAQGSRADRALALADELLKQAGLTSGEILLVTDGTDERAAQAAATLHEHGVSVSVLGVGTPAGAPIPLAKGGLYVDDRGEIVVAKLDEAALADVARRGGGRYALMRVDDADIDAIMPPEGPLLGAQSEETSLRADVWREEGPWLLLPLSLLGALAFRRGWLGLVMLACLPLSAQALDWDGLWHRDDQRGAAALERGDAERAAQLFADPEWKASALYRGGHYGESAQALAALDTERAHYNRGNALARAGDYPHAIEAYRKALELDPNDADARHNLELLEKQMQQQAGDSGKKGAGQQNESKDASQGQGQQGGGQSQDQQADAKNAQGANKQGEQGGQGSQQESPQSARNDARKDAGADASGDDAESAAPDAQSQAADASSEQQSADRENEQTKEGEQGAAAKQDGAPGDETRTAAATDAAELDKDEAARATEQWLRRIPDDPGGLLRRKFLYQYRQQQTPSEEEAQPW